MVKHLPAMRETRFDPWVRKIPWRRKWQPTPVLFPGKFHGWRSLVGYSPWGCRVRHDWVTSLSFLFSFDHEVTYRSKFKPFSLLVLGWRTKSKSISLRPTVFHGLLSAVSRARLGLPRWLSGTDSACQCRSCRDAGSSPGSGRSLLRGGGNGRPTQHSCLDNPMDRGAWCTTFRRVAEESDTTEVTEQART